MLRFLGLLGDVYVYGARSQEYEELGPAVRVEGSIGNIFGFEFITAETS